MFRECDYPLGKAGPADGSFHACGDDERERAFIRNGQVRVLDTKSAYNVSDLVPDTVAVVHVHARTQIDLDAAPGALLERDVQVGTNVGSGCGQPAPRLNKLASAAGISLLHSRAKSCQDRVGQFGGRGSALRQRLRATGDAHHVVGTRSRPRR